MFNKSTLARSLVVAGLLATAGAAQAAITVFTSLASFNAAVLSPGTDTFTGFNLLGSTAGPLNRTAGAYGYEASTAPQNSFFGAGSTADPWLSTNTATDTMSFGIFTGGVAALGGNFFGSNIAGAFLSGDIVVTATDADGTVSRTITAATTTSFLGFVSSTGALASATVASVQPMAGGFIWPTVDNLVLATTVPEPESMALLLAGLGIVGFIARRRRPV